MTAPIFLSYVMLSCVGTATIALLRGDRLAFHGWMLAAQAIGIARVETLHQQQVAEIARLTERVEVLEGTCEADDVKQAD